jgi:hypothetical protein
MKDLSRKNHKQLLSWQTWWMQFLSFRAKGPLLCLKLSSPGTSMAPSLLRVLCLLQQDRLSGLPHLKLQPSLLSWPSPMLLSPLALLCVFYYAFKHTSYFIVSLTRTEVPRYSSFIHLCPVSKGRSTHPKVPSVYLTLKWKSCILATPCVPGEH